MCPTHTGHELNAFHCSSIQSVANIVFDCAILLFFFSLYFVATMGLFRKCWNAHTQTHNTRIPLTTATIIARCTQLFFFSIVYCFLILVSSEWDESNYSSVFTKNENKKQNHSIHKDLAIFQFKILMILLPAAIDFFVFLLLLSYMCVFFCV